MEQNNIESLDDLSKLLGAEVYKKQGRHNLAISNKY